MYRDTKKNSSFKKIKVDLGGCDDIILRKLYLKRSETELYTHVVYDDAEIRSKR